MPAESLITLKVLTSTKEQVKELTEALLTRIGKGLCYKYSPSDSITKETGPRMEPWDTPQKKSVVTIADGKRLEPGKYYHKYQYIVYKNNKVTSINTASIH